MNQQVRQHLAPLKRQQGNALVAALLALALIAAISATQMMPPGCAGALCHVEGLVWVDQPLPPETIGVVLNRLGVDGGMTLPAGLGGAVQNGDMVFGHPDPNLLGNLSVAGVVSVGPDKANPCVLISPNGTVDINCAGQINAKAACCATAPPLARPRLMPRGSIPGAMSFDWDCLLATLAFGVNSATAKNNSVTAREFARNRPPLPERRIPKAPGAKYLLPEFSPTA
jgi:hypothetical protein